MGKLLRDYVSTAENVTEWGRSKKSVHPKAALLRMDANVLEQTARHGGASWPGVKGCAVCMADTGRAQWSIPA